MDMTQVPPSEDQTIEELRVAGVEVRYVAMAEMYVEDGIRGGVSHLTAVEKAWKELQFRQRSSHGGYRAVGKP